MAKSRETATKALFAAFTILKENAGTLPGKDLMAYVGARVKFDDFEKAPYEKTGYIRWQSILHFISVDAAKAGYLVKKRGTWHLTPEGEKAMELGPEGLIKSSQEAYRKWRQDNPKVDTQLANEEQPEKIEQEVANLDEVEERAWEGIKQFVRAKNPYEFQDLCAALLRGMGYYTPFVAPKGRDGGIDIMAYRDPLGTLAPRMKVQVKHRESASGAPEIQQLRGILHGEGDVGIFISSGGFSSDAKNASRSAAAHIELIDLERFIELWQQFYPKLSDEDKSLLPLLPVYFLAPGE